MGIDMKTEQLQAFSVLLLCCLVQAHPIVDTTDLNGNTLDNLHNIFDNFDPLWEEVVKNPLQQLETAQNTLEVDEEEEQLDFLSGMDIEDHKKEGVKVSLEHLGTERGTLEVDEEEEQLDFLSVLNFAEVFKKDGVKIFLEHLGTARNILELDEEQLDFLSGWNIEDFRKIGVNIVLEHLGPARNTLELDEDEEQLDFHSGLEMKNSTWLDFASWSSEYRKQIQKLLETGEADDPQDSVQIGCPLPMDAGTCVSKSSPPIFRWFHNPENGICEPFWFSGCGGNENNFETMDDCEKTCSLEISINNTPISYIPWDLSSIVLQ